MCGSTTGEAAGPSSAVKRREPLRGCPGVFMPGAKVTPSLPKVPVCSPGTKSA